MTTQTPRRFLVGTVFAVGLVTGSAPWGTSQVASAQDHSLYIAFTDINGTPVTDMTPEEVVVQWDGMACEILELELINWPLRVTVFVDNATESKAALPDMREGLRLFLEALPADIEVAIATIGGRPQFRARHTTDREVLTDAIGVLAPEGGAAAFYDALYEEAERMHEDDDRQYLPVILMVAVGGAEGSDRAEHVQTLQPMMDRLYENAAVVHTALFRNPYAVGRDGRAQEQWGSDIAVATRGTYEGILAANRYRTLLPELAEDLARKHKLVSNQYRVTYRPPDDASDQPAIQVGGTRSGVIMFPTDNGNIP